MSRRAVVGVACLLITSCQAAPDRKPEVPAGPLSIVATDAGHEGPDSVLAGVRHLRFENRGTTIHEAMLIRLPNGMTPADYAAAVAGGTAFPEGAIDCSGPGLTSPGETLDMWVELSTGRHILACWFRHPGADGSYPLHVAQGPLHEFVVSHRLENDTPPTVDATIRLVDFSFELDRAIHAGTRTIRVEFPGPSMHEMDLYRLHEGYDLADLRAWYAGGRKTPPPATALGGVLDSHDSGREVWIRREFVPGRYVAWCNMDMPAEPNVHTATHADVGMVLEFTVAN